MQNVILVIHLLLALLLIGAVLLQRSEGGALGIGGGGGNVMSGRGAATALQKATWGLAAAFIVTSLILAFLAIDAASDRGLGLGERKTEAPATPAVETPAESAPAESVPAVPALPDLESSAPAGAGRAAWPTSSGGSLKETSSAPSEAPLGDLPGAVPELPDAN